MSEYDNYFQIGIAVKPQGVKGELRVLPTTDDPERFGLLDAVTVFLNGHTEYRLQSSRLQKNMVILKLEGIDDRNAAEALVNAVIKIPPEKALPLDEDEYYLRDLIDMDVYSDAGEYLGRVINVIATGANDVYVIKTPVNKREPLISRAKTRELLIPAIKDCVKEIDVAGKKMTVRLLDGLRE